MPASDFVRWEDLDLDYHLGHYTDDETRNAPIDIDSDSDRENVPPPPKVRRKSTVGSTVFVCPVCQKELKTIGGFRGHVTKQHNNPHLKGSCSNHMDW